MPDGCPEAITENDCGTSPSKHWHSCAADSQEMQLFRNIGKWRVGNWTQAGRRHGNGIWSITCIDHVLSDSSGGYDALTVPPQDGMSLVAAVRLFLSGEASWF